MNPRTFPPLGLQLERRLEEVYVEPGYLVKATQRLRGTQSFEPTIANQLADNRTIFLLDPGLVVLMVGAATCKNDALLLAIIPQRVAPFCQDICLRPSVPKSQYHDKDEGIVKTKLSIRCDVQRS